jgi:hypothetical protein
VLCELHSGCCKQSPNQLTLQASACTTMLAPVMQLLIMRWIPCDCFFSCNQHATPKELRAPVVQLHCSACATLHFSCHDEAAWRIYAFGRRDKPVPRLQIDPGIRAGARCSNVRTRRKSGCSCTLANCSLLILSRWCSQDVRATRRKAVLTWFIFGRTSMPCCCCCCHQAFVACLLLHNQHVAHQYLFQTCPASDPVRVLISSKGFCRPHTN